MILGKIKEFWERWGYEIVISVSILVLVIYALTRIGKKGTWSESCYYPIRSGDSRRNKYTKKKGESKGESECRRVLKYLTGRDFIKSRPDFLRNHVTGGTHNLELDCYNSELGLAVEYSGIQHYKYVPHFHKNKEAFLNQKYRDDMKRRGCRDNGIVLIEVPYTVKIEKIYEFLRRKLTQYGYIK